MGLLVGVEVIGVELTPSLHLAGLVQEQDNKTCLRWSEREFVCR